MKSVVKKSFKMPIREIRMDSRAVVITVKDLIAGKLSHSIGNPVALYAGADGLYLGDGYHRVLQAVLSGQKHVKAILDSRFATDFANSKFWTPTYSADYGLTQLGFSMDSITVAKSNVVHETAGVHDDWLFHVLAPHKALSILTKNAFRLPLAETNSSEAALGATKQYYMSFARTPNSGYIADRSKGLRRVQDPVLLVFHRPRLERLRGVVFRPVSYHGADAAGRAMGGAKEAEERLFSNHPIIPGVTGALAEIRIIVNPSDAHPYTRDVLSAATKRKIRVKLFTWDNFQGYLRGVETPADRTAAFEMLKALKPSTTSQFAIRNTPEFRKPYDADAMNAPIVAKKLGPNWRNRSNANLAEWVYKTDYAALTKDARSAISSFLSDGPDGGARMWESWSSYVHNLRAGRAAEQDKFNRMMTHLRVRSPKAFFYALVAKWVPLREAYNRAEEERYYVQNPHKIPQRDFYDYLGSLVDQPDPPGYYGRWGTTWGRAMRDIIDSATRPRPADDGDGNQAYWRGALDTARHMATNWKQYINKD